MNTPSKDYSKMTRFHWRGLTSFLVTLGFLILTVIKALESKGLTVSEDESLRAIAEKAGLRPMEILELIRTIGNSKEKANPSP